MLAHICAMRASRYALSTTSATIESTCTIGTPLFAESAKLRENLATLARFSRSFALSAKSGVPIVQVLSIVAEVVDNAYLEARIAQMCASIERCESILRAAVAPGVLRQGVRL